VTDAWVTGTHAEHARTNAPERRFSAASSGGRRAMPIAGELAKSVDDDVLER
jgi:hypothetical protein